MLLNVNFLFVKIFPNDFRYDFQGKIGELEVSLFER